MVSKDLSVMVPNNFEFHGGSTYWLQWNQAATLWSFFWCNKHILIPEGYHSPRSLPPKEMHRKQYLSCNVKHLMQLFSQWFCSMKFPPTFRESELILSRAFPLQCSATEFSWINHIKGLSATFNSKNTKEYGVWSLNMPSQPDSYSQTTTIETFYLLLI